MAVTSYGRMGDGKCDGLLFGNGVIYQVYSPDKLSQARLVAKIDEDLGGAVEYWGNHLKKWIFVYNSRRGLPPEVPRALLGKRKEYASIQIEHLDNEALWQMACGLSAQERAELLGVPPVEMTGEGQRDGATGGNVGALQGSCWMLVHDVLSPIDVQSARAALGAVHAFGEPLIVRTELGALPWAAEARWQEGLLRQAVARLRNAVPRLAVFSLAPIPLAIHLGFILSDRIAVDCFQFDRDRQSWSWAEDACACDDDELTLSGVPAGGVGDEVDVVVRVSLSARVRPADTRVVVPGAKCEVDLACREPSVHWLRRRDQLTNLGRQLRGVLAALENAFPNCRGIHLFYAGPTGGAVVVGQQVNPRMNPPVHLYQYDRNGTPRHQYALTLGGA